MRWLVLAMVVVTMGTAPAPAQAWSFLGFGGTQRDQPPPLDFGDQSKAGACAITFDDGPGPRTGALLDLLGKSQTKATFFVLGKNVKRYPDLIRRMVAEGHEVENHSWDHPDMRKLDDAARQKEIGDTVALLRTLGVEPKYFRPPYGAYDPALTELAHKDGLEVVLWSRDSEDWRYHTISALEGNILPTGQGAHGIFLFHDIHQSTVTAMGGVLDDLKSRGCRFVTVSQFQAEKAQPKPPAGQDMPVRPASAVQ